MSRNDGEQRSRRQHSRREVSLADLLYAKPGRHAVPTVHSAPKQVVPRGVVGTIQLDPSLPAEVAVLTGTERLNAARKKPSAVKRGVLRARAQAMVAATAAQASICASNVAALITAREDVQRQWQVASSATGAAGLSPRTAATMPEVHVLKLALTESARRVAAAQSASAAAAIAVQHANTQLEMIQPRQPQQLQQRQQPQEMGCDQMEVQHLPSSSLDTRRPLAESALLISTRDDIRQAAHSSVSDAHALSTAKMCERKASSMADPTTGGPTSPPTQNSASMRDDLSDSDTEDDVATLSDFSNVLSSWAAATLPRKTAHHPRVPCPRQQTQYTQPHLPGSSSPLPCNLQPPADRTTIAGQNAEPVLQRLAAQDLVCNANSVGDAETLALNTAPESQNRETLTPGPLPSSEPHNMRASQDAATAGLHSDPSLLQQLLPPPPHPPPSLQPHQVPQPTEAVAQQQLSNSNGTDTTHSPVDSADVASPDKDIVAALLPPLSPTSNARHSPLTSLQQQQRVRQSHDAAHAIAEAATAAAFARQTLGSPQLPQPQHNVQHRQGRQAVIGDYCEQVIDDVTDAATSALLQQLLAWQERARALRNNSRSSGNVATRKRLVSGLREVAKWVRNGKACAVVVAPNIEPVDGEAGLSALLASILADANAHGIPVVFALSRKRMGQIFGWSKKMSAIAVLDVSGADIAFQHLIGLVAARRSWWRQARGLAAHPVATAVQHQDVAAEGQLSKTTTPPLIRLRRDGRPFPIGHAIRTSGQTLVERSGSRIVQAPAAAREFAQQRDVSTRQPFHQAGRGSGAGNMEALQGSSSRMQSARLTRQQSDLPLVPSARHSTAQRPQARQRHGPIDSQWQWMHPQSQAPASESVQRWQAVGTSSPSSPMVVGLQNSPQQQQQQQQQGHPLSLQHMQQVFQTQSAPSAPLLSLPPEGSLQHQIHLQHYRPQSAALDHPNFAFMAGQFDNVSAARFDRLPIGPSDRLLMPMQGSRLTVNASQIDAQPHWDESHGSLYPGPTAALLYECAPPPGPLLAQPASSNPYNSPAAQSLLPSQVNAEGDERLHIRHPRWDPTSISAPGLQPLPLALWNRPAGDPGVNAAPLNAPDSTAGQFHSQSGSTSPFDAWAADSIAIVEQ